MLWERRQHGQHRQPELIPRKWQALGATDTAAEEWKKGPEGLWSALCRTRAHSQIFNYQKMMPHK